jgi:capsular exopolysaccharide synthesis family protein
MNPPRKTSPSRSSHEKESAPISLDYQHLLRLCLKHWKVLAGCVVLGLAGGFFYAQSQTPIYAAKATIFVPSRDPNVNGASAQPDVMGGDMIKTFEALLQTRDLPARVVRVEHLNENPQFVNPPVSEEAATGMLWGDLSIHIRPLTRLIDITVENSSPEMAQMLANRAAEAAVDQQLDQHTGSGLELSDNLGKEVERLQQNVTDADHALAEYAKTHNLGVGADPNEITAAHLKDLNQQYSAAQNQVTLLRERYGEEHPKLIQAEELARELKSEVDKAQAAANVTVGQDTDYSILKAKLDSARAQLNSMLTMQQTTGTSQRVSLTGLRVSDPAELPYAPVRPNKNKSAAVGGFVGLLCGLCFIIALYFIDSSIRTVSQAESTFNLPVIAAIPILPESTGKTILPTFSDPQSFVAESFRGLRASLILHDRENPLKTVLVCSAVPGEGKSFCGSNLAVAFAQAGLRTLLIDADLRLPTLHNYFELGVNEESNGFQDILTGKATLATAVVPSQIPTLELLLTTTPADSPAELLSSPRLPQLLDEAAQRYDRVVIDSAPLNAVSDTMLIMQKADAVLLVIRAAQTPASESKSALQKIYNSKVKPLGLILNYLAPHTLKSYAYGYSYGQKPKEKNAK